jgi:hypothetical protein
MEENKNIILLYLRPCSLVEVSRRFGGTYCLCLQGSMINQANSKRHIPEYIILHTQISVHRGNIFDRCAECGK